MVFGSGGDRHRELSVVRTWHPGLWILCLSLIAGAVSYFLVAGGALSGTHNEVSGRVSKEAVMKISLPEADFHGLSLEEAILRRRSVRDYAKKPISLKELSQLLFSASGKTGGSFDLPLRAAPSAGALYPIEVYALVNSVEGLEPGIYHYSVTDHSLEAVKKGDFAKKARRVSWRQNMVEDSAVTFILSAIFDRCRSEYGERGVRYTYMEAGHISQNIYLQATSLGFGSVAIGVFVDDEWNDLLGVDGKKETVIYLHSVGKVE